MEARTLPSTPETLLIVDDEPLMTDLFRQFMTKRSFRVLMATSGQEALDMVQTEAGSVQMVITDMTMPGMDGIALARALEVRAPGLPVIIATGHETDAANMTFPANVIEIVKKPYQNRLLAQRIREFLDNRPFPPAS
jgi:DNA-binding NtrC family response regulator